MTRSLATSILLAFIILAGCTPTDQVSDPPATDSSPDEVVEIVSSPSTTPTGAQSTVVIAEHPRIWATSGSLDKAGNLVFELCLEFLDDGDWQIWMPTAVVDGIVIDEHSHEALEIRRQVVDGSQEVTRFNSGASPTITKEPATGSAFGSRCDKFTFPLPDGVSLHEVIVTIPGAIARPREGDECSAETLSKARNALVRLNSGITISCNELERGGGIQPDTWPSSMTEQDAHAFLFSNDFMVEAFGVGGPWTLEFPLNGVPE